jgi:hypothetical protein
MHSPFLSRSTDNNRTYEEHSTGDVAVAATACDRDVSPVTDFLSVHLNGRLLCLPSNHCGKDSREREREREKERAKIKTTQHDKITRQQDKIRSRQHKIITKTKTRTCLHQDQDKQDQDQGARRCTIRCAILILLSHDRYGICLTIVKESRAIKSRHEDTHKAKTETALQ